MRRNSFQLALRVISFLMLLLQVAAFSSSTTKPYVSTESQSAQLLSLLCDRYQQGSPDDDDQKIDFLIQSLISSKVTFDPEQCVDGGVTFCTLYAKGGAQVPLWEKISSALGTNLKGQKYLLSSSSENRVINYSEIWGNAVHLEAAGTFVEAESNKKTSATSATQNGPTASNNNNPFSALLDSFQSKNKEESATMQQKLSKCPCDYDVTVTGACIGLLGNRIDIPGVKGTGVARLLYADPSLRIFVSPTSTPATPSGENWESAGLVTCQVRADLVQPEWKDETKLLML